MDINELIQSGIKSLAQRDLPTAREYFKMALGLDPLNESAWMWMSKAVESDSERTFCLKQVLKINPSNQAARTDLQKIAAQKSAPPTPKPDEPLPPYTPPSAPPRPPAETAPSPVPLVTAVPTQVEPVPPPEAPPVEPPPSVIPAPVVISPAAAPTPDPLPPIPAAPIIPQPAAPPSQNTCPVCGRNDAIRRVISIVEEGTERTTGTHTTTSETNVSGRQQHWGKNEYNFPKYMGSSKVSGTATTVDTHEVNLTQQTNLASQLDAPARPPEPKLKDSSCVDLIMMVGMPIASIVLTVVIFINSLGHNDFGQFIYEWSACWTFPVSLIVGELLILFLWRIPASKAAKDTYEVQMAIYEKNELAVWKRKMVIWERLFYCFRDHVVFDPAKQEFCDPPQIKSFVDRLDANR
jgi:hypothetical protein